MALLKIKDSGENWQVVPANMISGLISGKSVKGGTFTVAQSYYDTGGTMTINHNVGTTPSRIVVFAKENASSISDNWTWIFNENQNAILRGTNAVHNNVITANSESFTITFPAYQFNPQGTYYWFAMD